MIIKKADCHIHMLLDGDCSYKESLAKHKDGVNYNIIRKKMQGYADNGIYFLRDGGDKFGISIYAAKIAGEYGINYLTPNFPIYKKGCYGNILGEAFEYENDYLRLVKEVKQSKANFLKIFASGILDFDHYNEFLFEGPDARTIKEMIHVGHEEGLKVMVHASGQRALEASIEYGADSIEHGFYMNNDCLIEMKERNIIWVPTISTVANLLDDDRFNKTEVKKIFDEHSLWIKKANLMGVLIASGSDAGAYKVPHVKSCFSEIEFLSSIIGEKTEEVLSEGNNGIFKNFV